MIKYSMPGDEGESGQGMARRENGAASSREIVEVRRLLSVEQAAAVLSVGRTTMYELLRCKHVSSVRIGRRRLVSTSAIDAYVATLPTSVP